MTNQARHLSYRLVVRGRYPHHCTSLSIQCHTFAIRLINVSGLINAIIEQTSRVPHRMCEPIKVSPEPTSANSILSPNHTRNAVGTEKRSDARTPITLDSSPPPVLLCFRDRPIILHYAILTGTRPRVPIMRAASDCSGSRPGSTQPSLQQVYVSTPLRQHAVLILRGSPRNFQSDSLPQARLWPVFPRSTYGVRVGFPG